MELMTQAALKKKFPWLYVDDVQLASYGQRTHLLEWFSATFQACLLGRIAFTHCIRCGYCYRLSSVVCLSVCLSAMFGSPANTAEPIGMPFSDG